MPETQSLVGEPLPSQKGAAALVAGDLSALPLVGAQLVGRAALVAIGMAVAGVRKPDQLIGGSLAASAVIELFVIVHELVQQRQSSRH